MTTEAQYHANRLSSPNCRGVAFCEAGTSTTVEKPLQISLFMQNKANFGKAQMNVNKALTKDYEKWTLGQRGKNEPKTNPIKANFPAPRGETKPKQTQYEPNQTQFQFSTMLNCAICSTAISTDKSLQQPAQKLHWQPHHVCQTPLNFFNKFVSSLLNSISPRLVPPRAALDMFSNLLSTNESVRNTRYTILYEAGTRRIVSFSCVIVIFSTRSFISSLFKNTFSHSFRRSKTKSCEKRLFWCKAYSRYYIKRQKKNLLLVAC